MAAELLRRGVRDHRRALAGWCLGVAAYVLVLAAIFPSIEGSPQFSDLLQSYPEAFRSLFGLAGGVDITKGAGFVDGEFFSLMLPLLAIALAIGSGARTLAGEEDAGRLELVFAYPVRRRSTVLAKGAAVGLEVAVFCAAVYAALALASPVFGLDLPFGRLAGGVLGIGLLALLHGWLALAVGAAWASRALAIGIPAALAAAAYLVGGLHQLASWLDPLRFVSSFWWIGQAPLSNGVPWSHLPVVGAAAVVTLVAAGWLIERRDLQTP
jgi:beta-exotoxin I transport system permease protein